MKHLNGQELADYIKERQSIDAKRLHSNKKQPKLTIFYDNDSPVISRYMALKKAYGADIGVEVDIIAITSENAEKRLLEAAKDKSVRGIIVQLPLKSVKYDILSLIPPQKDVDGLNGGMPSATAEAINWLLAGNNIDLRSKNIAIVGQGRLVGKPLAKMWSDSGFNITTFEKGDDLSVLNKYDLIVTATGVPGVIQPEMIKSDAVIVDAGTASEDGVIQGDVADSVRKLPDVTITPKIGGVGPLTVTLLFEHVLQASQ